MGFKRNAYAKDLPRPMTSARTEWHSGRSGLSIAKAESRPQQVARGVTLILAAALTISLQDVVFKLFSAELTLWQIFALRALMTLPLFFALAWLRGKRRGVLREALRPWPLLRAVFMTRAR